MKKSASMGDAVCALLLLGALLSAPVVSRAATQTFAAGQALTNLKTENVWPGAQDPPYICCWISQGQYVTFTFTAASGSTAFALRYSAGNGNITRKIELDGAAWLPDQVFPATPNWSTWATLTLSKTLTAGTHTLTIIFDTASGSAGYVNLDTLTVSQAGTGGSGSGSVSPVALSA